MFACVLLLITPILINAEVPGFAERGIRASDGGWYALFRHAGVLHGTRDGVRWSDASEGLPSRIVYPFDDQGLKDLTSVAEDPARPGRLAVTTSAALFIREAPGVPFREIPLSGPIKSSNYITSVALRGGKEILLGTSFNGYFRSLDGGSSWDKLSESLPELYRGAGFYEEVSGLALRGSGPEVALAASFTSTIYLGESAAGPWRQIDFPYSDEIRSLWYAGQEDGDEILSVWGGRGIYRLTAGGWMREALPFENAAPAATKEESERLKRASDRYGIYVNPTHASGDKLTGLLDFMIANGMNAVTVDMKDDWGWLTYDSELAEAAEVGSVRQRFDLDDLIDACHARGVYVVGRVVVFKDKRMYDYDGHRYAIWDTRREGPWGNRIAVTNEETNETEYEQHEFWVDPFSPQVWEYNLAIARELAERGVDEIQFDYIRFPSDSDLSRAVYRHRRPGMSRIEALESFLTMVRREIDLPLSTDLYGFNSWYRMGNWIGQNIELVSHYVDVICPMFYPSHFPRQFMSELPYLDRAERIYSEGSLRSARIAAGRSIIRPYVQAFLLPFEYYMEEPEYSEYLKRQLKGTSDSPASGFTLWNNTNRYYMVTEPLSDYTRLNESVRADDGRREILE